MPRGTTRGPSTVRISGEPGFLAKLAAHMDYDASASPSTWKTEFKLWGPTDPNDDDSPYAEIDTGDEPLYCWPGHSLQDGERLPSGTPVTLLRCSGRLHVVGFEECPVAIPE